MSVLPHVPAERAILWTAFSFLFILSLSIGINNRHRVLRRDAADPTRTVNDFDRWMSLLPRFIHHHADYVDDAFPNPPLTIALLAPFTAMSPPTAQIAWSLCKSFMIAATLLLTLRILRSAGGRLEPLMLILILFAWLWPVISDLSNGQTNFLMLLPLVAAIALMQSQNHRADILAGLLLALAISVKVTPVVFLAYVLLQRRWTIALSLLAGLAIWLFVMPGLLFGWNQNLLWLAQWSHIMLLPYLQHGTVLYTNSQSIPSCIVRFLTRTPAFSSGPRAAPVQHFFNILSLSPNGAAAITRAFLGGLAIAGLFWMRRTLSTFRDTFFLVSVSAIAIFMLLASERSWSHHFVTLILPLTAAGMIFSHPGATRGQRLLSLAALLVAALAFPLATDAGLLFGHEGPIYARALGNDLFPTLLLLVALCRNPLTTPAAAPEPQPSPQPATPSPALVIP